MIPNFTVIYDACVLYPNTLRDLLMELAVRNLYRAKWTEDIHNEWISNLSQNKPNIPMEKLDRVRELMNQNVRDCLVVDYQWLIPSLSLPDLGDRHVLAAAIKAKAEVIVTTNTKDFPSSELGKYDIEAQHQDTFIKLKWVFKTNRQSFLFPNRWIWDWGDSRPLSPSQN